MNDLFVYRTVRRGALSLAIALSITLAGFGSAAAGNPKAAVVVGFLGAPPANFQNVLLNVVAVRVNQSANAASTGPGWQKITVPAAIGGGGSAPPEIQIDLNTSQNIPELFNTGHIKPGSYRKAQLILDSNNPGTIVPNCAGGGILEGCITYPIQLANAGSPIELSTPKGTPALISPGKKKLTPLILQVQLKVTKFPIVPGGAYTVDVEIAAIPGSVFGTITGSVPIGSQAKQTRKVAVTAETIGTNTEIASAPVTPNASGTGGTYTLALPAAGGFGTFYDLAVAGGNESYGAARLLALFPGQSIVQDFTKLNANQTIGTISGKITDNCTGRPISNATIQLLIPPLNNPTLIPNNPDDPGDCTIPGNTAQCVSVATATTDNAGNFPQPGTLQIPAAFDSVPILQNSKTYTMIVSAPGYDSFIVHANAAAAGDRDNCSNGTGLVPCKIALSTGFISGTIPITAPPPGQTIQVQVFAEDTGTNNIVNALPMPVVVRNSCGMNCTLNYTINVPTDGRAFDLFTAAIDGYQGVTEPFPGHTIAVTPDVPGPTPPKAPGACDTVPAPAITDIITCTGHGSLSGFAGGADLGTSVGLAKDGVQITNTAVQNIGNTPSNNSFAFCVPGGDTYTVRRFELPSPPTPVPPTPSPSPTSGPTPSPVATPTPTAPLIAPTPAPAGDTLDVPVPAAPTTGGPTATPTATPTGGPTQTPTSTPTPTLKCPTTCSNPNGTCPGICKTVSGVSLP